MTARILGLALLAALAGRPALAEEACPAGQLPPVAASATKRQLASSHEVIVVALGSSSTQGVRATSPAASYPARLQVDLSAAFPLAHVAVINRGIGGQDAREEIARLDTDVLALRPDMVIWQVGANGAMEGVDPAAFKALVAGGIERMKALGIDVVLMDNQRSPMILASPFHGALEQSLADLAVKYDVSLFSRGTLMDGWKADGFAYASFLATDNVHMNDYGYRCVADALALSIEQGLGLADAAKIATARTAPAGAATLHAAN